jgi:hypothetical protein
LVVGDEGGDAPETYQRRPVEIGRVVLAWELALMLRTAL